MNDELRKIFIILSISDNYEILPNGKFNIYHDLVFFEENLNLIDISRLDNLIENLYGNFTFVDGKLNNLNILPKNIYGKLKINNTNLENLKGFPENVYGSVDLSYNHISSLEGLPNQIYGNLDLNWNELTNLDFLPKKIKGKLNIENNKIESLMNVDSMILGTIRAKDNKFTEIHPHLKYDFSLLEEQKFDETNYLILYKNLVENNEVDFEDLNMIQKCKTKEEAISQLSEKIKILKLIQK